MKKLRGLALNISQSIVGKITFRRILGGKKNYIFVSNKKNPLSGYAATIINRLPQDEGIAPILCNIETSFLHNGDIILLEPNGVLSILYERNAWDNCLMLTQRCNCSCIMCPQTLVESEEDRTHLNLKLISLMSKKTSCLGLTGGEPTLLGNKLIDIIQACKKFLPIAELNLLTNGIKLQNLEYVKKLISVRHPKLIIEIPLYADTDKEHNKIIQADGFFKTIKGLYNLALFNQRIGIRIVMLKLNFKRLPHLANFIYRNFPFVHHIAFMQMETVGLAKNNLNELWIDPFDYNKQLEEAVIMLAQRGMNVSIYNAQLCILPKSIWKYTRKSISAWKNIYLEDCEKCGYREQCGGLFASSMDIHSKHIHAITKD